ncbi:MAG: metal ABC transporter substrate-binding protein [Burkholderiales bacterium]
MRQYVRLLALFALGGLFAQQPLGAQPFKIVTTTTELRNFAEIVGGDRVAVTHLIAANTNAESYQAKPQDLARVKEADLIVRVGLDYDLWLDRLLERARPELRRRGPRHVDASIAIALLDVRGTRVGPSDGHAHGSGNPHYWLDPRNVEIITGTLLEGLVRIDPTHADAYLARRRKFVEDIERRLPEWEAKLANVRGKPLVAYHNTWAYFARRFRLKFIGYIELREGIPPSAAHLAQLATLMRDQQVRIVVRQPHESAKDADFIAQRAGARVAVLAASINAIPAASNYLAMIDYNIAALVAAAE